MFFEIGGSHGLVALEFASCFDSRGCGEHHCAVEEQPENNDSLQNESFDSRHKSSELSGAGSTLECGW